MKQLSWLELLEQRESENDDSKERKFLLRMFVKTN
jgi:hypothetical protein